MIWFSSKSWGNLSIFLFPFKETEYFLSPLLNRKAYARLQYMRKQKSLSYERQLQWQILSPSSCRPSQLCFFRLCKIFVLQTLEPAVVYVCWELLEDAGLCACSHAGHTGLLCNPRLLFSAWWRCADLTPPCKAVFSGASSSQFYIKDSSWSELLHSLLLNRKLGAHKIWHGAVVQ